MEFTYWPGAYNFKEQIGLFLEFFKEQIDSVLYKISLMSV